MTTFSTTSPSTPDSGFSLSRRKLSLMVLGLGLSAAACGQSSIDANSVSLEVARADHEAGRVVLIDIREPAEHATGVAAGARLLPMRQLGSRLTEIPTDPSRPVFLICNTQNRSSATLRALRERGYGHVRYVQGGMSEWARRGWPMIKPKI
ncbi:rhodanese-like domain-containing protein [Rhodoferax sp.]|uniref:rhodanese-like domain-containing protein n=1 Tax=Rhodoferax sp. TaxID=50421 RepID=UPI00274841D3|nr:rhodanese-like domain-containing protein [Rhodoferax sp.]